MKAGPFLGNAGVTPTPWGKSGTPVERRTGEGLSRNRFICVGAGKAADRLDTLVDIGRVPGERIAPQPQVLIVKHQN